MIASFRIALVSSALVAALAACSGASTTDPGGGNTEDGGASTGSGSQAGDGGSGSGDGGSSTHNDAGGGSTGNAPTWSQLWSKYLASGTIGRCPSCHSQTGSASGAYTWLKGRGYMSGSPVSLVSASGSCLSWFGGNMPPSGPSNAQAVSDFDAWAAAGAPNN